MARGGLFAGLNAGLKSGLQTGGLNASKRAKPKPVGLMAGVNDALAEGDFTIEDRRINAGKPTNVPSAYNGQTAPFPKNDPRFRDWIVKNALKMRKKYRSFGAIEEAMAAAKSYGQKRV